MHRSRAICNVTTEKHANGNKSIFSIVQLLYTDDKIVKAEVDGWLVTHQNDLPLHRQRVIIKIQGVTNSR